MPVRRANRILGGHWELSLLGGFSARNGDIFINRFPSQAVQLLLVRLALSPGHGLRKEMLIDWLWPDAPPREGGHRLRAAKSDLKRLLEPPGIVPESVLTGDRETIVLRATAVRCDAVRFQEHLNRGEHAQALALYRGELIPALQDEFIDATRQHLHECYEKLAARLGAHTVPAEAGPRRPVLRRLATHVAAEVRRLLPEHTGGFLGRAAETQRLHQAAASARRLVVVTGPGGCGKTRLCVEAARSVSGFEYVAFIGLGQCQSAADIVEHIRAVRGLQAGARSTLDQVVADLETQAVLLILDNYEQFAQRGGAELVNSLQARLPRLHLWLSSRVSLGVPRALELPLSPLPLPAVGDGPAAALRVPSVALFLLRARLARADFQIHNRNVAAVVSLCRLLDGVPLAIELAAARIRLHSPAALCRLIAADWSTIASVGARARGAGRHASIDMLVNWSWRLLSTDLQSLLALLTVFDGGWTLAQAAAVAGIEPALCRRRMDQLVAASMVPPAGVADGQPRWQLLRSVRDTVCQLDDADAAWQARRRHRAHFLALAHGLAAQQRPAAPADVANLVAAFTSALRDDDTEAALALSLALLGHWGASGVTPAAAQGLRQLVAKVPGHNADSSLPGAECCRLLAGVAPLFFQLGGADEARRAAAAAVALAGADAALRATAEVALLNSQARSARAGEAFGAQARQAVALARSAGVPGVEARAMVELGRCVLEEDKDPAAAQRLFAEAEALMRAQGDELGELLALPGRLACLLAQQRHAEALAPAVRGLERARRLGHAEIEMLLFNRHGAALEGLRRWRQAIDVYQVQARSATERGMAYHFAFASWNQCQPLLRLRLWPAATRLLGFSAHYWVDRFAGLKPQEQADVDALRLAVREQLGNAAEAAAWAEGWALPVAEGVALACGSY